MITLLLTILLFAGTAAACDSVRVLKYDNVTGIAYPHWEQDDGDKIIAFMSPSYKTWISSINGDRFRIDPKWVDTANIDTCDHLLCLSFFGNHDHGPIRYSCELPPPSFIVKVDTTWRLEHRFGSLWDLYYEIDTILAPIKMIARPLKRALDSNWRSTR